MRHKSDSTAGAEAERLRPLRLDELVRPGDFVDNGHHGFEPWDGPGGFRADAFVKQIYRQRGRQSKGAGNHFEHDKKILPDHGPADQTGLPGSKNHRPCRQGAPVPGDPESKRS